MNGSGMNCKFCGKAFNPGFNLRRHQNKYRPLKGKDREMSETESQTVDSEDDASTATTHGSESLRTGDSETEEEEANPWVSLVEEAMLSTFSLQFLAMKSLYETMKERMLSVLISEKIYSPKNSVYFIF